MSHKVFRLFVSLALALVAGFTPTNTAFAMGFYVNSTFDGVDANPGDSVCDIGTGECTLRAAIQEANALPGNNEIALPAGDYILTIAGANENASATGDLDITDNLIINGTNNASTIIDGGAIDRVFHILSGSDVEITGATIQNGRILGLGGGLSVEAGTLVLNNSIVRNNKATWGGVFNGIGSTATLNSSTVMDNIVFYNGGGIYNLGTITLNNSTVSSNIAETGGGFDSDGLTILNNSTISGNTATDAGGFYASSGSLFLNNSTVSNNSATDRGGGIYKAGVSTVALKNSIVAGNSALTGPDCYGDIYIPIVSSGYNLIGNSSDCIMISASGDLLDVDPVLAPLADNGGPTLTHSLLPGSPSIDAGTPAGCTDQDGNPLTTDQRGIARPQGPRCDIGAFESEVTMVEIDIKPGNSLNRVNLKSEGVIPVAILTTEEFDASIVDRDTVLFGVTGNEGSPVHSALSDVNKDGDMDVILHFNVMDTVLAIGDTIAKLTGQTTDGQLIEGSDSINIVNIPLNIKSPVIDLGTLGGTYSSPQAINERGQVVGVSETATGEGHAFFWQNGVMTEIGTLGGAYSEPYSINKYGQVLGSSLTDLGGERAFFWEDGVLIDLGTLGGANSYPQALNNRGQAVGSSSPDLGDDRAFLWQNGVMIDLGTLGGVYSSSTAINDNGQIIGASQTESGEDHAFLWQDGVMTDLGTFDGFSVPNAINDDGQIIGVSRTDADEDHAFFWQDGIMTDLGTLGGNNSVPSVVNESGQVVGFSQTTSGEYHTFFWQDGVMTDLGTLGGAYSYPQAINERGQIIGASQTASGETHPFLWQDGIMNDLGTLGGTYSYPQAINERGQVIGVSETTSGEYHAFLWQNGVMTDLTNLGMLSVQAIDDHGQIIGITLTSSGEYHAAVLKK